MLFIRDHAASVKVRNDKNGQRLVFLEDWDRPEERLKARWLSCAVVVDCDEGQSSVKRRRKPPHLACRLIAGDGLDAGQRGRLIQSADGYSVALPACAVRAMAWARCSGDCAPETAKRPPKMNFGTP